MSGDFFSTLLEVIAKGSTFKLLVFNLIVWAERSERVFDLIDGAYAANDRNASIQKVWEASHVWRKQKSVVASDGAAAGKQQQKEMQHGVEQKPQNVSAKDKPRQKGKKKILWLIAIIALASVVFYIVILNNNLYLTQSNADHNAIEVATLEAEVIVQQSLSEARLNAVRHSLDVMSPPAKVRMIGELAAGGDISGAQGLFTEVGISSEQVISTESGESTRKGWAILWVQEGERLLRDAGISLSEEAKQQAVISATTLFSQALSLNPPPDTLAYLWIEPGEFAMGSTEFEAEAPQSMINVDGFWIMRTEVTNAQYRRCVEAAVCTEPRNYIWDDPAYAEHPVTYVDWNEANAYAKWAGGRLPTEAEWEKACRGTDGRIYPWGDEPPPTAELANFADNVGDTTPVGSYPSGASPYGVLDMAGNVREWTSSLWGENSEKSDYSYPYNPTDGREKLAPSAGYRVVRGGAFDYDVNIMRCAARMRDYPYGDDEHVGFRVVLPP